VNKELDEEWKEVVVAYFEVAYYSSIFLEGQMKITGLHAVSGTRNPENIMYKCVRMEIRYIVNAISYVSISPRLHRLEPIML
jgi:hypothetical protein